MASTTPSQPLQSAPPPSAATDPVWRAARRGRARAAFLAILCIALVGGLQGVDPAVHSVAMPAAAKALNLDPGMASFIKSLGTIVLAASLLGAGIIGDNLGRRRVLLAGVALMAGASVLSALAAAPWMLGLGRAVMGVGTALSFSMCLALIPALTPKKDLPRSFAIFFGLGAGLIVLMTSLSGAIQSALGWRWNYGSTAVLCVVLGAAAWFLLPESRSALRRRFDLPGVVLAGAGLVALVYSIGRASVLSWTSPEVLVGLAVAVVGLGLFALWESRTAEPGFPVRLFRNPAFAAACLAGILFNWADASLLGQYPAMAIPGGVSPSIVSVIVAVMYFGMVLGSIASGIAQRRFGLANRSMFVSGLLLCAAGLAVQLLTGDAHDIAIPTLGLLVVGFAVMWMQNPQAAVILGSAPADQTGAVGAVKPAVGQFGFGLGFAVAGPIAGLFTTGKTLDVHAYGLGLATQSLIFVAAALLVGWMLRPRKEQA